MICKIIYALYGVKLNAQNFRLSRVNSLSVALRAGYLSVRTAEGASEKKSSLKARLRNGLTYLLTYLRIPAQRRLCTRLCHLSPASLITLCIKPYIDQVLLQFIDVVNLVDLLLHFSTSFVVRWVQICAVGYQRCGEMKAGLVLVSLVPRG